MITSPLALMKLYHLGKKYSAEVQAGRPSENAQKLGTLKFFGVLGWPSENAVTENFWYSEIFRVFGYGQGKHRVDGIFGSAWLPFLG
jgi:hypothetical protein